MYDEFTPSFDAKSPIVAPCLSFRLRCRLRQVLRLLDDIKAGRPVNPSALVNSINTHKRVVTVTAFNHGAAVSRVIQPNVVVSFSGTSHQHVVWYPLLINNYSPRNRRGKWVRLLNHLPSYPFSFLLGR